MKNSFIKTAALLCAVVFAFSASAAYTPAGTVTFANLNTIADAVAGIAGKGPDPLLQTMLPKAIRGQVAARLFGAMRPGMPGVAVCYVDAQAVAKLTASSQRNQRSDEAFDRTKFWSILYPASIKRAVFLQKHPESTVDKMGVIRIPPGPHSRRTFFAWYSPDGNWVTLAPSVAMATHTYRQGVAALARPLGRDLAYVKLDPNGVRAIFQSDICAGAEFSVRMTQAGLELRGTARKVMINRAYLPPNALVFPNIPANAPLFGVTTDPKDIRSFDIFSFFGECYLVHVVKRRLSCFLDRALVLGNGLEHLDRFVSCLLSLEGNGCKVIRCAVSLHLGRSVFRKIDSKLLCDSVVAVRKNEAERNDAPEHEQRANCDERFLPSFACEAFDLFAEVFEFHGLYLPIRLFLIHSTICGVTCFYSDFYDPPATSILLDGSPSEADRSFTTVSLTRGISPPVQTTATPRIFGYISHSLTACSPSESDTIMKSAPPSVP